MLYENICDKQELTLMSEGIFTQHYVENKQLKKENETLNVNENENESENEQFKKNKIVKDANIK